MASSTKLSVSGYRFLFALFLVLLGLAYSYSYSVADSGILNVNLEATCPSNESSCSEDPEGFEAISRLHALIDDDQNGGLDRSESEEFFREDLKHDNVGGASLHNYDDFITVLDLWKYWFKSEAYNWTVSDVILWLNNYVELPQYAANFHENSISGRFIPKLATNIQSHALLLGIKNAVHKQKLSIKSTDLVLFGPPKTPHNFKKDVAVIFSLLVGLGGCYFAYRQHKASHLQMQKVMKDLTSLQNAEDALAQVQNELEKAQKEQKIIANDKQKLERHLKDEIRLAKAEAELLKQQRGGGGSIDSNGELKVLEDELMKVKLSLYEAERRLEENQYVPLFELQIWLQLTYEIEKKYFDAKKEAAQNQLLAAKQMWEKIRKQKSKFLGSFRVAHTTSLDETDQQIMNVRTALDVVKMDLQERTNRWQEIEKLCHFNISTNPGVDYLTNVVKSDKLHSLSRYGYNSADDLSESGKLKKRSGDGTKLGSSTDSLGNISKDTSLEGSGVVFELGVADMHASEPYLMIRNSMTKSKSMGDCIKLHSDNETGRGSTSVINDQTTNKLTGAAVAETQTSASKEDGNSSDSSFTLTEDSMKKKKSKLLNFIKHKKHE